MRIYDVKIAPAIAPAVWESETSEAHWSPGARGSENIRFLMEAAGRLAGPAS